MLGQRSAYMSGSFDCVQTIPVCFFRVHSRIGTACDALHGESVKQGAFIVVPCESAHAPGLCLPQALSDNCPDVHCSSIGKPMFCGLVDLAIVDNLRVATGWRRRVTVKRGVDKSFGA